MPDPERQRAGRLGGLTSWRQIPDRYERMAHVRENSPGSDSYWAKKLGSTFTTLDDLTTGQLKKISTARKLYFAQLRQSSVGGMKPAKTKRLRERAAAIDAEIEARPTERFLR